ncbi:phage tail protein, partial [Vibrio sp. 10N.222.55.F8]
EWINSISLNRVEKKDLMISLTDESGSELLASWNVQNAFPTGLTAPSFDAAGSDISVQEITLVADRVTIQTH